MLFLKIGTRGDYGNYGNFKSRLEVISWTCFRLAGTLYGADHQGICRITHISWKCIGPFLALEKRIKQDKKHPGVLIELRKSTALWDIAYFVREKVITMNDLEGFSADLIDAVKLILSRWERFPIKINKNKNGI